MQTIGIGVGIAFGVWEVVTPWWGIGVMLWGLVLLLPKVRITVLPVLESILLFLNGLLFILFGFHSFFIFMPIPVLFIGGVLFLLYRLGRSKNYDKRFSVGDYIYVWGVWAIWSFGACLGFVVLPTIGPDVWYSSYPDPIASPPGPFYLVAALLTLRMIWYVYKETRARQRYLLPLGGISSAFALMLWLLVFYADDALQLQLTNDCYQCDLSGANLSSWDLSGADLRGANLAGANLTDTRLDGARLNASIRDDEYWPTSLDGANLAGASLVGTNLENARMNNANFTGANLREANFRAAAWFSQNINLAYANLAGANGACFSRDRFDSVCDSHFYCGTTMPDGTHDDRDCSLNDGRNALVLTGWHERLIR